MSDSAHKGKARKGEEQASVRVQVAFLSGPERGMVKTLKKETSIIGRADCDIIISDQAASKKHAEFSFEDAGLVLRDLNSTNGTLLNGGQVWEAVLKDGDEIQIGDTQMVVRITTEDRSEDGSGLHKAADTSPSRAPLGRDPLAGPLPEGAKASIKVAIGPDSGARHELLRKGTLIGRGEADIILSDPDVSRKHASIEFLSSEKVIIKDLRSRNGTFLNDKRITVANLKNGDSIQVGSTVLNFFFSAGKQPAGQ